jgi:hypothetical protein
LVNPFLDSWTVLQILLIQYLLVRSISIPGGGGGGGGPRSIEKHPNKDSSLLFFP